MHRKSLFTSYMFLLPGFLFFCFFLVYPLGRNFIYSFFSFKLTDLHNTIFVGIDNYIHVVQDRVFWISLKNIVIYGIISVPGQMFFGFLVAYALHKNRRGLKAFRVFYFLPVITSWVVASLMFKFLFMDQGLLNYVLTDTLHWSTDPIKWLSEPGKALLVISFLGIWKGVGWVMIIYMAALQGVPKELYEAAALDGSHAWNQIRYITLPAIKNTTLFIRMMLIIGAFNVFTSVFLITKGGPLHETEVMLTWMYQKAFTEYDLGYASALSYVFAVIIACLTYIQFRLNRQQ